MNDSTILLGLLAALGVAPLIAAAGLCYKPSVVVDTIDTNHLIPIEQLVKIETARREARPAIFHGGCHGCIWRHQNTTHTGILFCRGCQYFDANWEKPNKAIREVDLEIYS